MDKGILLILLTLLPLAALAGVLALPREAWRAMRAATLATALAQLVIAVVLAASFNAQLGGVNDPGGFQFVVRIPWVDLQTSFMGGLHLDFVLGLDGISMPMVLLASLVFAIAVIASWNVDRNQKGYFALLLLLNTGIIGSFAALDLLLFYFFLEMTLLPVYFLIGIWGGERREYAATKYVLTMLFGSVLLLLGMIGLADSVDIAAGGSHGVLHTFDMMALMNPASYSPGGLFSPESAGVFSPTTMRTWGFLILLAGLAIRLPMVPFHTWLPDAHTEAPTPVTVILSALVMNIAAYGMLRICFSMFPDIASTPAMQQALLVAGGIGAVYASLCAMAQTDMKRIVAYVSIAHMSFVAVGLGGGNAVGLCGTVFQMVNHGLVMTLLVLLVGALADRVGDRTLAKFGGLMGGMPAFAVIAVLASFAAIGIPGLAGWWSQSFAIVGAFQNGTAPAWTIAALLGMLLGAAALLRFVRGLFLGPLHTPDWRGRLRDLTLREWTMLALPAALLVLLGVWPALLVDGIGGSVNMLASLLQPIVTQRPPF
ncbi:MAG TPA: NADH-quinone oxidoreductase subunit M [Candidatus Kapabacteria bacterium]|nr:NADH-quinone oxidoreductase subunit M [Candidatus Kapabacteria bacterium]